MSEVSKNDIVQLNPENTENKMFSGCFMVISEIKSWGIQGYVQALGQNGEPGGQAYYRAKTGTFERVGEAHWVFD